MPELWQRGRVTLEWSEAHDLHGLQVVMRRQPLGEIVDEWLAQGDDESADWNALTPKGRALRSQRNADELAAQIIGWNLADENGAAVELPALDGTPETRRRRGALLLLHCDNDMIAEMRIAYNAALTRLSPPLPESSGAGPAAPEPPGEWDLPAQEVSPSD